MFTLISQYTSCFKGGVCVCVGISHFQSLKKSSLSNVLVYESKVVVAYSSSSEGISMQIHLPLPMRFFGCHCVSSQMTSIPVSELG